MIAVGDPSSPSRLLSARFDSALVFAAQLHATQARKGSGVPYVAHLLAVTSLVLEHGPSRPARAGWCAWRRKSAAARQPVAAHRLLGPAMAWC